MIKRNYIGIISSAALVFFILMLIILSMQSATMPANYLKLTGASFIAVIVFSALFAIRSFDPTYNKRTFNLYFIIGTGLVIFGSLVAFNALDFSSTWNILVACLVAFMVLTGLEIMDWNISKSWIVKSAGIGLIVSGGFLFILFIALWSSHLLRIWLDIATIAAVACLALGIIFSRKTKKLKNADRIRE